MGDILGDCVANAMEYTFGEEWVNLDRDWQRILIAELKYMHRSEEWETKGVRPMVDEFARRIRPAKLRTFAESVMHHHTDLY